jgi:hypothetical protein
MFREFSKRRKVALTARCTDGLRPESLTGRLRPRIWSMHGVNQCMGSSLLLTVLIAWAKRRGRDPRLGSTGFAFVKYAAALAAAAPVQIVSPLRSVQGVTSIRARFFA